MNTRQTEIVISLLSFCLGAATAGIFIASLSFVLNRPLPQPLLHILQWINPKPSVIRPQLSPFED